MIRGDRSPRYADRRALAAILVLTVGLVGCGSATDGDAPLATAPAAHSPAPETPEADAPAPETATPEAPEADTPEADTPEAETPVAAAPEAPAPADATPAPGDCSAAGAAITPRAGDELPAEVAALRDLLLDAALRCDEQLLRTAIDESGRFTYSFGASGDAIGAWWELEAAGEQPFLRLAQVLGTTPALADGGEVYVWPQVTTGRPETTTDAAWAELTWLDDPAATAAASGGYLDHRVGISTDGQWRFFVAGD